jgi:thioredoxin 1
VKKLIWLAALLVVVIVAKDHFAPQSVPEGPPLAEEDLIRTVSNGEAVELFDVLDEGEWTVVQFTAPWCPGCRQLEPRLEAAIRERGNVRLRRVNIADWSSPVARQFGIQSIPQLWLHDGTKRVATDTADVLRRIEH